MRAYSIFTYVESFLKTHPLGAIQKLRQAPREGRIGSDL